VRHVEVNTVRAGLADQPEDCPWSSAHAHLSVSDEGLLQVAPMLGAVDDWTSYMALGEEEAKIASLRRYERTGRPLGSP
jgi:hypothetical protein